MGCVFLVEATDQPPPRECWLYIWSQETHSNVYTCLLELSVGMECVCIYTIWQFKCANLNPYEARRREMFTVSKKIKSRKLMHSRTMKTSDPVQPIIISH